MAGSNYNYKKLQNFFLAGILTGFISCSASRPSQQNLTAIEKTPDSILVDREGNQYIIKPMQESLLWMTGNLKLNIQGSYCYENEVSNCQRYGRLYSWSSAQKVCGELGTGWRLPTDEEWLGLSKSYGLSQDSTDYRKKAFRVLMTGGASEFHAVLGGGRNPDGSYQRQEAHGFYWTSTENDSSTAVYYNFARGSQALFRQQDGEKIRAFTVRCVKTLH